jgi:DNA end-binding protein Ku
MAELITHTGAPDEPEEEPDLPLPRALWSGSLNIGLVNIPVKAVSIARDSRINFRMLPSKCKAPISYKRFCDGGGDPLG